VVLINAIFRFLLRHISCFGRTRTRRGKPLTEPSNKKVFEFNSFSLLELIFSLFIVRIFVGKWFTYRYVRWYTATLEAFGAKGGARKRRSYKPHVPHHERQMKMNIFDDGTSSAYSYSFSMNKILFNQITCYAC
jgi:hypothetical protein